MQLARFALLASVVISPIDQGASDLLPLEAKSIKIRPSENFTSKEQVTKKIFADESESTQETSVAPSSPQNTFTAISIAGVTAPIGGRAVFKSEGFDYFVRHYLAGTSKKLDYSIDISKTSNNSNFDAAGNLLPNVTFGQDDSARLDVFTSANISLSKKENLQVALRSIKQSYNVKVVPNQEFLQSPGQQLSRGIRRSVVVNNALSPGTSSTDIDLKYTNKNFLGSVLSLSSYYRRLNYVERSLLDNRNGFFDEILRRTFGSEIIEGKLQVETPLFDRVRLQWGADYKQQTKDAVRFELFDRQTYDRSDGRIAQKISEVDYVPSYQLGSFGLFTQANWQINNRLKLSAGVRYNLLRLNIEDYTPLYDNDYNRYEGNPISGNTLQYEDLLFNAGLSYQLTSKLQLYTVFEQESFIPDYGFDILSFPPRDLKINTTLTPFQPQKVNTYKLGLEGQWQQFQATFAAFYQDSSLGAVYTATSNGSYEIIRAPQRNYGIQAAFNFQPSTKWQLGAILNYSLGQNDRDKNGKYLALSSYEVSPLTLTAYIENQTSPGWRNRLQMSHISSRKAGFESGADALPILGYTVFDLSSTFQIGRDDITLNIQNLLNQSYQTVNAQLDGFADETLNLPGRGRTISLIYRIRW
ncbi:MAG: TonB-dependent receptor [Calothrix sp. C42_A2020_038]|nr:TonB-dependent receptor [Calothrix sp. C42_A2020_038]